MAIELLVYGPIEVPYSEIRGVKHIGEDQIKEFWQHVEAKRLKLKCGCYIFATRAGRGFQPWYVGKASKGFRKEIYTDHKLKHYNKTLHLGVKGTPVMFFVAPAGNKNVVPKPELDHMEKELIQDAVKKNPALSNMQNTKNLPQWSIKGVIRSSRGKPAASALTFKTMMGI